MQHNEMVPPGQPGDEGLTLVEVIVSISLLAIFALAFAPVLYNGLNITAGQATVAYAAQRASSYIDDARHEASPTCAGLVAATATPSISVDPRQVRVKVSGTVVAGCSSPPTVPTAVTLTVIACRASAGSLDTAACSTGDKTLTKVTTKILVRG